MSVRPSANDVADAVSASLTRGFSERIGDYSVKPEKTEQPKEDIFEAEAHSIKHDGTHSHLPRFGR
jgi:hypothetical protein